MPHPKPTGFIAIIILIVVLLVGLAGAIFIFAGKTGNNQQRQQVGPRTDLGNIPPCGQEKEIFTQTPIKFDKLWYIRPLGFIGQAPEHIAPTDHIYLYPYGTQGGAPIETDIYSPGDMWITTIDEGTLEVSSGEVAPDYSLYFSPCSDIEGYFLHLSTISNKLKSELKPPFVYCEEQELGRFKTQSCRKNVNIKVSAGELLGTATKDLIGMDFTLSDYREKELDYANPDRWRKYEKHLVCPLDYFEGNLKAKLKSLLGERSDKRTIAPVCGEVDQDIKGTAQGTWFSSNPKNRVIRPEFSLIHDNIDPTIGAIAIGILDNLEPAVYFFTPTNSGLVNRDFKDIKDKQIYCFDKLLDQDNPDINKKPSPISILVQLINPTTLKVGENNNITCDNGPWTFNKSEELER